VRGRRAGARVTATARRRNTETPGGVLPSFALSTGLVVERDGAAADAGRRGGSVGRTGAAGERGEAATASAAAEAAADDAATVGREQTCQEIRTECLLEGGAGRAAVGRAHGTEDQRRARPGALPAMHIVIVSSPRRGRCILYLHVLTVQLLYV
jgi:hypothetical protein